jgi:hypothetical protein
MSSELYEPIEPFRMLWRRSDAMAGGDPIEHYVECEGLSAVVW